MTRKRTRRRRFGTAFQPTGRKCWQAKYRILDKRYLLPGTFATKAQAEAALDDEEREWVAPLKRAGRLHEYVPPKKRAERARAEHEAQAKQEELERVTVGDWLTRWLEIKRPTWKESTYETHRRQVAYRILDVKGDGASLALTPLVKLRRADVMRWWDAITVDYDTPTTNRAALGRLTSALGDAVKREMIDANPAANLGIAKPVPRRKELPKTEVLKAVLDQVPDRHKIITVLTFFHGMRIGEVLGLRRKDIEQTEDGWVVHVRGNATRIPKVGMVRQDKPKTDAGYRVVPVFPVFVEVVRHHLDTYVAAEPDAMVCVTETGSIVMDTSYRGILQRAKEKAGYGDLELSSHYGRVWAITHLVEAGLTIPAIGEILGQRHLKTITEVYMRTSDARKREVLAKINEELG